jgi:hypothetical protein
MITQPGKCNNVNNQHLHAKVQMCLFCFVHCVAMRPADLKTGMMNRNYSPFFILCKML